jgi:hypothetical protein
MSRPERMLNLHRHQPARDEWVCRSCFVRGTRRSFPSEEELIAHREECLYAIEEDEVENGNELDEYGDLIARAEMETDDDEL